MNWLPDMDLNHDKQIQSLLCYRYTIGQADASGKLENFAGSVKPSNDNSPRFQPWVSVTKITSPVGAKEMSMNEFCRPCGTRFVSNFYPRLKPWAIFWGSPLRGITHHASRITF